MTTQSGETNENCRIQAGNSMGDLETIGNIVNSGLYAILLVVVVIKMCKLRKRHENHIFFLSYYSIILGCILKEILVLWSEIIMLNTYQNYINGYNQMAYWVSFLDVIFYLAISQMAAYKFYKTYLIMKVPEPLRLIRQRRYKIGAFIIFSICFVSLVSTISVYFNMYLKRQRKGQISDLNDEILEHIPGGIILGMLCVTAIIVFYMQYFGFYKLYRHIKDFKILVLYGHQQYTNQYYKLKRDIIVINVFLLIRMTILVIDLILHYISITNIQYQLCNCGGGVVLTGIYEFGINMLVDQGLLIYFVVLFKPVSKKIFIIQSEEEQSQHEKSINHTQEDDGVSSLLSSSEQ